jgi:uncharacterized membrane-anchored protein YjiN (DUF445 family)
MNAESDAQRTALRRMRRVVTGLLVAAAVCLVLACTGEAYYPVLGFVHAFCEAAMAGGLADWFAVTSRFRHPPGVPLRFYGLIFV